MMPSYLKCLEERLPNGEVFDTVQNTSDVEHAYITYSDATLHR